MKIPAPLLNIMLHTDEPWSVVDNSPERCFAFVNPAFKVLGNLPDYDFEGRLYKEIPHSAYEQFSDLFIAHDHLVISKKQTILSLETHPMYKEQQLQSWLCEKQPLCNAQGEVVGTINHLKQAYLVSQLGEIRGHVLLYPPNSLFTSQEWSVIYLLLYRYSSTQIAKILKLSRRKLLQQVNNCLHKAEVSSDQQLIALGEQQGWQHYIPDYFFTRGLISMLYL